MKKVGDTEISPYLLQRLRSLEEVEQERSSRRQRPAGSELPPTPPTPAPNPTPDLAPASGGHSGNPNDKAPRRPGSILDKKA